MDHKDIKEIGGLFSAILRERDSQGRNVLVDPDKIDYQNGLLSELEKLERANSERKNELRILSKFIRNKLWRAPINTRQLCVLIHEINSAFGLFADVIGYDLIYNIDGILEYVSLLAEYKELYSSGLDIVAFEEVTDDIIKEDQGKIIKAQWDDVQGSADGMATFIRVFDDVFNNAIQRYEDKFITRLSEDMILTRCVKEENCDEDRFIPCPNKTNNRWNPPGKTYLYLSPKEQEVIDSPDAITGGQYVNLLECRIEAGTPVCFCDFKAKVPGRILNLSYNDTPLYSFRRLLMDEDNRIVDGAVKRLLIDPEVLAHYGDEAYIRARIERETEVHPPSRELLSESVAKQYLKSICSCIYTKVDDSNEAEKERIYKSFHILAEYLESKGITGIIYPSTRTKKMEGNNIVLFNIEDAEPVKGTVKPYLFE